MKGKGKFDNIFEFVLNCVIYLSGKYIYEYVFILLSFREMKIESIWDIIVYLLRVKVKRINVCEGMEK